MTKASYPRPVLPSDLSRPNRSFEPSAPESARIERRQDRSNHASALGIWSYGQKHRAMFIIFPGSTQGAKSFLTLSDMFFYYSDIGKNMSDGPHKSLPMRRGWKRVAEWADKAAFEGSEVEEALISALQRDCEIEITNDFVTRLTDVCNGQAVSLFGNALGFELEALRPLAGPGIGRVVLEFAIRTSEVSVSRGNIPLSAVVDALIDRLARNARQVEEHYCRKSTLPRADRVRRRIEKSANRETLESLARDILRREAGRQDRPSARRAGLDDGVRL